MPEIINALFGRSKNDTAGYGEDVAAAPAAQTDSTQYDGADVVVTDETVGTDAIEAEPTETATVEPTGDDTTTEDVAEDDETSPSADDVVESTEAESTSLDSADSDSENIESADESTDADDQADDDQADDEPAAEAAIETAAEESDEAATDEDLTPEAATEVADEDGESAADIEPVAVETEDAPVATETDADDVEETEPIVEPVVEPVTAETRPTAGTRGTITVGEGVAAKVVNIVVGKVDGVHSIDEGGISVEVDDDIATIKVSLVIEYGHAIKALAEQIRVDVIEAVEQLLGLDVAAVDVHVSDINLPTTV